MQNFIFCAVIAFQLSVGCARHLWGMFGKISVKSFHKISYFLEEKNWKYLINCFRVFKPRENTKRSFTLHADIPH